MLPGPQMTSTAAHRLGAVGQGADGLGPADGVHLVDAGDRGGGQRRPGRPTRWRGRAGRTARPRRRRPPGPGPRSSARSTGRPPVRRARSSRPGRPAGEGADDDAVGVVDDLGAELRLGGCAAIRSRANSRASRTSVGSRRRARRRSRRRAPGSRSSATPSKRSVSSSEASSPRSRTSARISRTAATGSSPSTVGPRQATVEVGDAAEVESVQHGGHGTDGADRPANEIGRLATREPPSRPPLDAVDPRPGPRPVEGVGRPGPRHRPGRPRWATCTRSSVTSGRRTVDSPGRSGGFPKRLDPGLSRPKTAPAPRGRRAGDRGGGALCRRLPGGGNLVRSQ